MAAAVIKRDVKKIKFLLDNGVSTNFTRTRLHIGIFNPILHIIIDNDKYGDDYEIVEMFLEKGMSPNEPFFMLPLYMAVKYSKFKICQSLIKYEANIIMALTYRAFNPHNRIPFTKFMLYDVIKSKNVDLLKDILKHINLEFFENDYFRIPMIYSLIERRREEIKLCIKYGFQMQYTVSLSYQLYIDHFKETKFAHKYHSDNWHKFGEDIEEEVLNEPKNLSIIILSHLKDEGSYFSMLPFDVLKLIIIEAGLSFLNRRRDILEKSIKKCKME